MLKPVNGRVAMLAASGLLLLGSAVAWKSNEIKDQPLAKGPTARMPELQSLQATMVDSNVAQVAAPVVVTPAAQREVVFKQSRSQAGRLNPMTPPVTLSAVQPSTRSAQTFVKPQIETTLLAYNVRSADVSNKEFARVYNKKSKSRRSAYSGFVPPPPPGFGTVYPAQAMNSYQYPVSPVVVPPKHEILLDNCRVVGIMDNKAIFHVLPGFARAHNLPPSFMIGQGEQFGSLQLESLTKESVTIREGRKVATLELGPIR